MVVAREQLVFVACGRAVQDDFAFVVNIADRHGVGIAVVAVQGEHAGFAVLQNGDGFFVG